MGRTLLVCLCLLAGVAQTPANAPRLTTGLIALTFDDLPKSQGLDDPDGMRRTTHSILRVLRAHHAPAVAFVNEEKLYSVGTLVPERVSLLKQWIDAGVPLGNHTYSHSDLNHVTVEQYERDIEKGEPTFIRLMRERGLSERWFRHPYTHTGEAVEKKAAVDRYLASRGYRVAPFTIENSDWLFSAVYARAREHGDAALAERAKAAYLSYNDAMVEWFESLAREDFQREIPQILLIHANEINTDGLDVLLTRLEARGYRYVTLAEAMNDPAYATADEYIGPAGPSWLHRWRIAKKLPSRLRDEPDRPAWVIR